MAISYDSPAVLERVAAKHGVTFPLLSDAGSPTIRAYGLLNEEASGEKYRGIPHPGTILVDGEGIVRGKLFHEGFRERHLSEEILAAAAALD